MTACRRAFELDQRLPHRPELLDRADALGAPCGVRGEPANRQSERQCPGVGGDDVELGGLRDHARVGSPPALEQRERAESAVLLALHRRQYEVAAKPDPGRTNRPHRGEAGDQPGLHVAGAAPENAPVTDLSRERLVVPRVGVADRDHVDVPVQHQRRAVTAAREPTDETPGLRPIDLRAREVGHAGERVEIEWPVVHLETAVDEPARHLALRVVLGIGAAHTRDAHEVADLGDHRPHRPVDMIEHVGDDVAHRSLPRAATIPRRASRPVYMW